MDMSIIVIFIRFGNDVFISLIFNIFIMDDNWMTILIWILVILLRKKKRYCQYIFQIFFFRNVLVNVLRASSILLNAREIYLQEWGIRLLIISMIRSRYRCSLVFQSRHLSLAYFGLKARFGWSSANGWYHRCTFWRHNGNHHWVLRRWKNKWDIRIHLKQVDVKKFREIENVGYKLQIENQN